MDCLSSPITVTMMLRLSSGDYQHSSQLKAWVQNAFLRKLGYTAQKAKPGSTGSFFNPRRSPNVVSFREPHPGDNLRQPALRDYLRKLLLSADEFIQL
jgi:hypothetical protein